MPIYSNSSGSRVRSIDYEVAVELLALGHGVNAGYSRDEVGPVGVAGLGHRVGMGGEAGHDQAS